MRPPYPFIHPPVSPSAHPSLFTPACSFPSIVESILSNLGTDFLRSVILTAKCLLRTPCATDFLSRSQRLDFCLRLLFLPTTLLLHNENVRNSNITYFVHQQIMCACTVGIKTVRAKILYF